MPPIDRCRVCGARELEFAYAGSNAPPTGEQVAPSRHHPGEQPEMHRCLGCGSLLARAVEGELVAAYADMADEVYVEEEAARRATCRRLLDAAGVGRPRFRRRPPTRQARARGIEVVHGILEEAAFPAGWFDAVFMIDVIEHLADPVRTLAEVARVLRPGGTLCLVTPDASAVAARLAGAR